MTMPPPPSWRKVARRRVERIACCHRKGRKEQASWYVIYIVFDNTLMSSTALHCVCTCACATLGLITEAD